MRLWIAALLLFAAPVYAGLLDAFGGKKETEIAAEFEKGLGSFLTERLARETAHPRIYHKQGNRELYLEVVEVKDDLSVWQELAAYAWDKNRIEYAYKLHGPTHEMKTAEIEPGQVAHWFVAQYRPETEILACAVWVCSKGNLMAANAKLAELSQLRPGLKAGIEEWLCVKHGWTKPEAGLRLVVTHDLKTRREGALLLTIEAEMERLKALDKEAKTALAEIEQMQGDDLKSKPGWRKRPPKMRLDLLLNYCERYKKAYAGTKFLENKRNAETLEKIVEAIKADVEYIENGIHQADRHGIDKNWQEGAKAWEGLLRTDPLNPDWILKTAEAHANACMPKDRGMASEHPDEAKRAAELYEQMVKIFPRGLAYNNYAGKSWLAAGDKAKAKAHFQEVVRRTDGRSDLDDNEKQNRKYAEDVLKEIK